MVGAPPQPSPRHDASNSEGNRGVDKYVHTSIRFRG
jgi:hypothetical protein